jgi:hypothetical protein
MERRCWPVPSPWRCCPFSHPLGKAPGKCTASPPRILTAEASAAATCRPPPEGTCVPFRWGAEWRAAPCAPLALYSAGAGLCCSFSHPLGKAYRLPAPRMLTAEASAAATCRPPPEGTNVSFYWGALNGERLLARRLLYIQPGWGYAALSHMPVVHDLPCPTHLPNSTIPNKKMTAQNER